MSSSDPHISVLRAREPFTRASGSEQKKPSKRFYPPFSMRLSAEERKFLEEHVGDKPWATFIRERVFEGQATPRRSPRRVKIDDQQLANILGQLGASRLASNVNQLAKSANMGTIDLSEVVEQQLQDACAAIFALRDALITALGLKSWYCKATSAEARQTWLGIS